MVITYEDQLDTYVNQERLALKLINFTGKLALDRAVELVFFKKQLTGANTSKIMQLHRYANDVIQTPITLEQITVVAENIYNLELTAAKIDLGKLTQEWLEEGQKDIKSFLNNKLANILGEDQDNQESRDVVLFGFGRIGRLVARELIEHLNSGQKLRLRAIVTRSIDAKSLEKRASLLANDSVHGSFAGTVEVNTQDHSIIVNGQRIKFISGKNPQDIDYTAYGISNALLIDNTGVYRDYEGLSLHKQANGIEKVILTAPGKEVPNIVYGINQKEFDVDQLDIFSAASCTTNAISPILKVIQDKYGIESGHIETVHSYTNDQNLLDNMHKKERRGRSAAVNMVITETGAGKAVVKIIPSLKDKLTANAVRIPTPNGSLAIIKVRVNQQTTQEDVNTLLKSAALQGDLVNQIHYATNPELVSNDIIGNNCCSIFDSNATIVAPNQEDLVLYVWYDNEFGYSKQVIRLAKHVAKVRRKVYY